MATAEEEGGEAEAEEEEVQEATPTLIRASAMQRD
jgi:hypothetical protein